MKEEIIDTTSESIAKRYIDVITEGNSKFSVNDINEFRIMLASEIEKYAVQKSNLYYSDPNIIPVSLFKEQWIKIQQSLLHTGSECMIAGDMGKSLYLPGVYNQAQLRQIELNEIASIIETSINP